jgi:hypothetical protein
MQRAFVCEQCQAVCIAEFDDHARVFGVIKYLEETGCAQCGGTEFTMTDDVEPYVAALDEEDVEHREDCTCGDCAASMATQGFMLYMAQYSVWSDPTEGAVTPDLSEFFHFCDPKLPALVHWARWLRLGVKCDHHPDAHVIPEDRAEELMEAMIATKVTDQTQARMMRMAFHEGFGTRDPDQLELFSQVDRSCVA